MTTCPDCGSSNFSEDGFYSEHHKVCVDCGSVINEGLLTVDFNEGQDIRYSTSTAVTKRPCENLIKGLQRVTALCRVLSLNKDTEDLSQTYYKRAYQHRNFINVRLEKKEALVGCCVLASCRMYNTPIAMGSIAGMLESDPLVMSLVYQEMVRLLQIEAPSADLSDILGTFVQDFKIGPLDVPEEFAVNNKDLTKRAVGLAELAGDSWIVTGRKPLPILMAAIFLAWQSLKPTQIRLRYTLDKFCRLAKVKKNGTAMRRIAEIKEVLCKLGREIPWVVERVTPDSVVRLVGDILENRNALLRSALRAHENTLQSILEDASSGNHVHVEEASPSHISLQVEQNTSCVEADSLQYVKDPSTSVEQHNDAASQEKQASASHWGKRALFAPPCVRNCKVRRVERPVMKEVTGDEDISDSEIDMYIRTPQEVREITLANDMLNSF